MKSIMRAMVPLLQVLVLTMFVILIYATVGLSFLVNKFHATCYDKKGKGYEKNKTGKEARQRGRNEQGWWGLIGLPLSTSFILSFTERTKL